jgi:hypothetical protein
MLNETEFMLLFRMQPSSEQPTQEQLQQMEQQWGGFISNVASQGKLVSTHHLGFSGNIIARDQSITEGFSVLEGQMIAGNMVIKANTMDMAIEIAKQCPILFVGGTVEIRNIMTM